MGQVKQDVEHLKLDMEQVKQDIVFLKKELPLVEARMQNYVQDKIHKLTVQMGMMIAGSFALVVSIMMYFK